MRSYGVRATVAAMPNIQLKQWAKRHRISRRKAEYLASVRPDLVVMVPQKVTRIIHVKAVDSSTKPDDFRLRG